MPYMVSQAMDLEGTGGGPRVTFSNIDPDITYFVIGAYNNVNNIDSGSRPMVIVVNGGLAIQGLQPAPAGSNTVDLVIDKDTGKIYRQS